MTLLGGLYSGRKDIILYVYPSSDSVLLQFRPLSVYDSDLCQEFWRNGKLVKNV